MSQWTHVSGMLRFDALRTLTIVSQQDVYDLMGKSYYYDMDGNKFSNTSRGPITPMGSGGPVQYHIEENPTHNSMASYDVAVWGDLRDFGEDEVLSGVANWLARITSYCKSAPETRGGPLLMLRALIVQAEVEFGNTHLFLLSNEELQHTISKDGRFWGEVVSQ